MMLLWTEHISESPVTHCNEPQATTHLLLPACWSSLHHPDTWSSWLRRQLCCQGGGGSESLNTVLFQPCTSMHDQRARWWDEWLNQMGLCRARATMCALDRRVGTVVECWCMFKQSPALGNSRAQRGSVTGLQINMQHVIMITPGWTNTQEQHKGQVNTLLKH